MRGWLQLWHWADQDVTYWLLIIEDRIRRLDHQNGQLKSIFFDNEQEAKFDALYVGLPFEQHSPIAAQLECELTETGHIKTNQMFKTSVDGVYACGDNVSPMRSVANAVSSGTFVGTAINRELAVQRFAEGNL